MPAMIRQRPSRFAVWPLEPMEITRAACLSTPSAYSANPAHFTSNAPDIRKTGDRSAVVCAGL